MTHELTGHFGRICEEAGLGVMVQVLEIVTDREEVTEEQMLEVTADDVTRWYEGIVAPAIDSIEDELLEETEAECENCGNPVEEAGFQFCHTCLEAGLICGDCGAVTDDGDLFRTVCFRCKRGTMEVKG